MRTPLCTLLLVVTCCLLFSQQAKAQGVNTYSTITYDGNRGVVWGTAGAEADYNAQIYYSFTASVYLYDADGNTVSGNSGGGGSFIQINTWEVPATADMEFSVDASYETQVTYSFDYYFVDFYNMQDYQRPPQVEYPLSFSFFGPGPRQDIFNSFISLGVTYALRSLGGLATEPDHLKVLSDDTIEACGCRDRYIRFLVVDDSGRRAVPRVRSTRTKETFHDPNTDAEISTIYSSCDQSSKEPSRCTDDPGGVFTDHLFSGCPPTPRECGTAIFVSKWWWCPRGRSAKVLSSNRYHVGCTFIRVNGSEDIPDNTQLR